MHWNEECSVKQNAKLRSHYFPRILRFKRSRLIACTTNLFTASTDTILQKPKNSKRSICICIVLSFSTWQCSLTSDEKFEFLFMLNKKYRADNRNPLKIKMFKSKINYTLSIPITFFFSSVGFKTCTR